MPKGWILLAGLLALGLFSCATHQVTETDPHKLLAEACAPGGTIKSARGGVAMKAASREASGQFPASVEARSPGWLKLEVTNLIGGTEAIISVQNHAYKIEVPGKPERNEKGSHSWAGIPLQWASDLFLGKIPCPVALRPQDLRLTRLGEGELQVEVPAGLEGDAQIFVYHFRNLFGRPWPESLHWERKGPMSTGGAQAKVDFRFEDPENTTRSPLKWEAKSPQGEVKVRWKDRELN